jgi:hypothetical protein
MLMLQNGRASVCVTIAIAYDDTIRDEEVLKFAKMIDIATPFRGIARDATGNN